MTPKSASSLARDLVAVDPAEAWMSKGLLETGPSSSSHLSRAALLLSLTRGRKDADLLTVSRNVAMQRLSLGLLAASSACECSPAV